VHGVDALAHHAALDVENTIVDGRLARAVAEASGIP